MQRVFCSAAISLLFAVLPIAAGAAGNGAGSAVNGLQEEKHSRCSEGTD